MIETMPIMDGVVNYFPFESYDSKTKTWQNMVTDGKSIGDIVGLKTEKGLTIPDSVSFTIPMPKPMQTLYMVYSFPIGVTNGKYNMLFCEKQQTAYSSGEDLWVGITGSTKEYMAGVWKFTGIDLMSHLEDQNLHILCVTRDEGNLVTVRIDGTVLTPEQNVVIGSSKGDIAMNYSGDGYAYGNVLTLRCIAVADTIHTDEQIIQNTEWLTTNYVNGNGFYEPDSEEPGTGDGTGGYDSDSMDDLIVLRHLCMTMDAIGKTGSGGGSGGGNGSGVVAVIKSDDSVCDFVETEGGS